MKNAISLSKQYDSGAEGQKSVKSIKSKLGSNASLADKVIEQHQLAGANESGKSGDHKVWLANMKKRSMTEEEFAELQKQKEPHNRAELTQMGYGGDLTALFKFFDKTNRGVIGLEEWSVRRCRTLTWPWPC